MNSDLPSPARPLKIGTRGSPLALAQAHETRQRLIAAHGLDEAALEIVVITTSGDRILDRPLSAVGGKGLFTKEIEEALTEGAIDIAVHSMKDMPVVQPDGLILDCFLPREDPRDAIVGKGISRLADLPRGAVVGTSSLRRRAQILHRRPDLRVVEFRGNVQTRLRKLADGVAEATFLAMAGLNRLQAHHVAAHAVDVTDMLPAVAQGAIGIERRNADDGAAHLLAALNDGETATMLAAERAFLAELDGSCQTPIAGLAQIGDGGLSLAGEILRPDGALAYSGRRHVAPADAAKAGRDLARALLAEAGPGFFD